MKFKRIMGIVLAVVMVMSSFTVVSFAATQNVQPTRQTSIVFGTPTIDGTITGTEWDAAVKVDFPYDRNGSKLENGVLTVPAASAVYEEGKAPFAMAMWDDNYLYAYFRVYDDHIITDCTQIYHSDSVELYIDELNEKCELNVDSTRFYQISIRADGGAYSSTDKTFTADDYKTTINEAEGYYEVEMKYPWYVLDPLAGKVIGIDFAINNTNESDNKRDNSFTWNDQTNKTFRSPVYVGEGILVGGSGAAQTKYNVTYDANGGEGAPEAQLKTENVDLVLSTDIPTRDGFEFKGWATSAGATVAEYAAGATYTANNGATLYAVWAAIGGGIVNGNVTSSEQGSITADCLWEYNRTTKVLTITTNKTGYNETGAADGAGGWADFNAEIEEVVIIGDNIEKITSKAFMNASKLKKITLPKSITQVDEYALSGCTSLETVCVEGSPVIEGVLDFSTVVGSNEKGSSSFAKSDVFSNTDTMAKGIILSSKYSDVIAEGQTEAPALNRAYLPKNIEVIYGATEYLEKFAAENDLKFVPCGKSSGSNIYWTIDEDNVMTLIGEGALTGLTSAVDAYAADVKKVVIPATVTEIADGALAALTGLESAKFEGNAPVVADGAKPFGTQSAEFVVKVSSSAEGFGENTWCGYTVERLALIMGDANGDGFVNTKDVVAIAQFVAEWGNTINEAAADVNGSSSSNTKDVVLLAQFVAEWDVDLVYPPEFGDVEVESDKVVG